MPFLTEDCGINYPRVPGRARLRSIVFPIPHAELIDAEAEDRFLWCRNHHVWHANIRSENEIDTKAKIAARLRRLSQPVPATVENSMDTILRLASSLSLSLATPPLTQQREIFRSTKDFELFIAYDAAFGTCARKLPLAQELERLTKGYRIEASNAWKTRHFAAAPELSLKGLDEQRSAETSG